MEFPGIEPLGTWGLRVWVVLPRTVGTAVSPPPRPAPTRSSHPTSCGHSKEPGLGKPTLALESNETCAVKKLTFSKPRVTFKGTAGEVTVIVAKR